MIECRGFSFGVFGSSERLFQFSSPFGTTSSRGHAGQCTAARRVVRVRSVLLKHAEGSESRTVRKPYRAPERSRVSVKAKRRVGNIIFR